MALLKDLIVTGASRFIGDAFFGNVSLNGCTLSGDLKVNNISDANNLYYMLKWNSGDCLIGPTIGTTYIRSGNSHLQHRKNGTDYIIYDSSNLTSLPANGGTSDLTKGLLGSGYTSGDSNIIKPFWNTKSDNRWYLLSANTSYLCRVDYATSAGSATDSTKLPLAGGTMTQDSVINMSLSNYGSFTDGLINTTLSNVTKNEAISANRLYNAFAFKDKDGKILGGIGYLLRPDSVTGSINSIALMAALPRTDAELVETVIFYIKKEADGSYKPILQSYYFEGELLGNANGVIINSSSDSGTYDILCHSGNTIYNCASSKLYVQPSTGNVTSGGNFYADSDIRYKNVINNLELSSSDFCIDLFKYTWKDREDANLHVGTSAQVVENIIPELVTENKDGFKSLDYATLGAIAGITACKEIEMLKDRIKILEDKLSKYE